MRRGIKFRGKRYDTGGWVYGDLIQRQYAVKIGGYEITPPTSLDPCGDTIYVEDEVIPETVGQFTGLLDKNNNEIFEGDVIAQRGHENTWVEYNHGKWVLRYDDEKAEWRQELHNKFRLHIEIIGNIHDQSPETNKQP